MNELFIISPHNYIEKYQICFKFPLHMAGLRNKPQKQQNESSLEDQKHCSAFLCLGDLLPSAEY